MAINRNAGGALSSPIAAGSAALAGRFLLLGTGAATAVLLPLCLPQDQVGLFFLCQAVIAALVTVALLGLSVTAPALVSRSLGLGDAAAARGIMCRSFLLAGTAALLLGIGFAVALPWFARHQPGAILQALAPLAPLLSATMVLAVVVTLALELHRVAGHFVQASFLAAGASVASAATVLVCWRVGAGLSLAGLLAAGLAGTALCTLPGSWTLWRWWRGLGPQRGPGGGGDKAAAQPDGQAILRQTAPNLGTTAVLFMTAQADLWIIASVGSAEDIAVYGLASRIAALVLIPLAVTNSVIAPSIGAVWSRNKRRYLQEVMGAGAAVSLGLACAGYLVFLAFGPWAMGVVWSAEYAHAWQVFAVLGAAQLVQCYAGSSGYALMMLGKQGAAMRVSVAGGAWLLLAGSWAMVQFGILGLAVAWALGGAIQALAMAWLVRRHFGLAAHARLRPARRLAVSYLRKVRRHG